MKEIAPPTQKTKEKDNFKLHQELAYGLFEQRGGEHGRDWGDWFATEHLLSTQEPLLTDPSAYGELVKFQEGEGEVRLVDQPEIEFSDEQVQVLAHKIWEEKGKPFQNEEEMRADWSKAIDGLKEEKEARLEIIYEIPQANYQGEDYEPTDDEIRKTAYEIWQQKGETHGHDVDDWYEAREMLKKRKLDEQERPPELEYEPTDGEIRPVAYEIWERKAHGHDVEDWFEARDFVIKRKKNL